MPRNGTGTYVPPASSWVPAVNGVNATAADFNGLQVDLTAALTQSVSKDGQTPMTGNLPMGNNKITGLANGTAVNDAATFAQTAGRLINIQIFSSSGIYTSTFGTSFVLVEAIAPGGGGGATTFTGAGVVSVSGGGGGGGYALARFNSGFSGLLATPGTGGAGGVAGPNSGQPGGTLTFGGILSVQGGFGGAGVASGAPPLMVSGGQGGASATIGGGGTLILTGSGTPGGNGFGISNTGGLGGAGGASGRGTGTGFVGGYSANGPAAQSAGAGGCGTFTVASTANGWAGGAGGNGRIVIYEFS